MGKKVRNASIIALVAGVALVPVVRYLVRRFRNANNEVAAVQEPRKGLFSAYRGHHKPHHRKAVNIDGAGVQ